MKSNNKLFCGLLVLLLLTSVCLVCVKNKFKRIQSSNNNTNTLENSIKANETILVKENFQNSLNQLDVDTSKLSSESEKNKEEEQSVSGNNVSYQLDEDANIDDLLEQLDTMEDKCKEYEDKERTKLDKERQYLKEKYREQLEIENDKIEQLKDLVNYYRRRYYKKLKINNDCRKKIQGRLDEDTDFIKDIGGLAEDYQPKMNIDKKKLINQLLN
jgi:hypothetical protein